MLTLIFLSPPAHLEMLRTEACEVASNSSSSLREVLAERRPRRWISSRILVRHPSSKTTACWIDIIIISIGDSALGGGFVWGDSLIDVTYCIILIVYSPQPYPIFFVTTGDQVCLGRSPDEMAMRPPLLVNHSLPSHPWTYQSTLPHPHHQHNPHLHHCLLL